MTRTLRGHWIAHREWYRVSTWQFLDGRVIRGISDILKIVGHPVSAWRWLISPKSSIGGIPLELLKQGPVEIVIEAAESNFEPW